MLTQLYVLTISSADSLHMVKGLSWSVRRNECCCLGIDSDDSPLKLQKKDFHAQMI